MGHVDIFLCLRSLHVAVDGSPAQIDLQQYHAQSQLCQNPYPRHTRPHFHNLLGYRKAAKEFRLHSVSKARKSRCYVL